ncbi:GCP1 [Symbiodinium sp. CCMP2592]|nr:GCP1 [Symbiodinium sp. CCMP2592]
MESPDIAEVLARLRIEQRRAAAWQQLHGPLGDGSTSEQTEESAEDKYKQAVIELRITCPEVKSLTKLLGQAKQQEEEKKEEQRDAEMQEFGKQLLHLEELAKLRALDVKEDLRDREVIEFKQELNTLEEQQRPSQWSDGDRLCVESPADLRLVEPGEKGAARRCAVFHGAPQRQPSQSALAWREQRESRGRAESRAQETSSPRMLRFHHDGRQSTSTVYPPTLSMPLKLCPRSVEMTGVEIESEWIEGTPGHSIVTPDGLASAVIGVIHELETACERNEKGLMEMPAGRATSLCQGKAQDSTMRMLVQAMPLVCNNRADLRFVQVWNIPPDVLKKFVKKAGGSSASMAPVGAQLVMVKSPTAHADVQTAVLEAKSIPEAEALVGAIEKWKVGIPKMKAKVISEEDFENLLEKSTTCVVFVKNVPEDIEDESDIKNMGKDIERAQIGHHPQHGRYAIIQARSHGAARSCVDVFNIPHSGGVMTAELMTVYQQEMVLKGSSQSASRKRNGQRRSRSRRR